MCSLALPLEVPSSHAPSPNANISQLGIPALLGVLSSTTEGRKHSRSSWNTNFLLKFEGKNFRFRSFRLATQNI